MSDVPYSVQLFMACGSSVGCWYIGVIGDVVMAVGGIAPLNYTGGGMEKVTLLKHATHEKVS